MNVRLARRMAEVKASDVRELLKITEQPEVISLAGGLPAPELFPSAELAREAERLLREDGARALQYSTTEGYEPLRAWIAAHMTCAWGAAVAADEILVTSGSQQGLDLTAKLFLDEGDLVLCESPTYLAALQSFQVFGPRCLGVPTDDDGLDLAALERVLRRERPKFIYVIPNAQNPSGRTWSLERRRAFVELVTRHEIPVVEDAAYGDVIFDGAIPPALKAFDSAGLVVTLGTFSKILCPGLRLGWVAASPSLREKYVILKQSTDLHTPTLTQMLAARWLQSADFGANLARIRALYRERRDVMVEALERELPGLHFTRPLGGLFVWLQLPAGIDARELLRRCLERQVAFVPGASFFAGNPQPNTARLNFSNMPPERIREGIRRLAAALRQMSAVAQPARELLEANL
jgi:DNA-binding transcriptional MocR family regulator